MVPSVLNIAPTNRDERRCFPRIGQECIFVFTQPIAGVKAFHVRHMEI